MQHPVTADARRRAGAAIVVALGAAIAIGLAPFLIGLIGAPVLAVAFGPLYRRLVAHLRPAAAAALTIAVALVLIMVPALAIVAIVIDQLPAALSDPGLGSLARRASEWRIGTLAIGREVANASGQLVSWASHEILALAGTLTRTTINLVIAFFGMYYLLVSGDAAYRELARILPFPAPVVERLRERFHSLTMATVLGTGVTALLQGSIIGVAFMLVGLDRPLLWGSVTAVVSVLPVLGSALVWVPGTVALLARGDVWPAIALAAIGAVVASNVDNVVRPILFRRVSNIHPLITLVGAFAGLAYFGILGVLLGPLALAYFGELVRAFEPAGPAGPTPILDSSSVR